MKNPENKETGGKKPAAPDSRQQAENFNTSAVSNSMIEEIIQKNKKRGILVVVSAPSGTGKTTLCRKLVEDLKKAVFSISVTSRQPRPGEKNGYDYIFVTEKEFKRKIKTNKLLEWAKVHNRYYGTSRDFVRKELDKGKYVILDIDVQGGLQIKEKFPSAVLIFIMPPSAGELKKRIENRKSESPREINKRLVNARDEIKKAPEYDYMIINREIERAVSELKTIITAESLRI